MRIGSENDPAALRKEHWERSAEEVGIKPCLVLTRVSDLAQRIQAARLPLFKGAFARYRCDALYRLMELIDAQSERARKIFF
jgi:serine/threonine-protein kinase HipA